MDLSVIILNYNTPDITSRCVDCVLHNMKFGGTYEIVVLDNASHDDSVDFLHDKYKDNATVRILSSSSNLGFGRGMNYAAKQAKGSLFMLLNSDVYFESFDMDACADILSDEEVGFLGTKILYADGKIQFVNNSYPSVKNAIKQFVFFSDYHIMSSIKYRNYKNKGLTKSDWISGCIMMCTRDTFMSVKGFDESIFMYNEDLDICARVEKNGKKNYVYDEVEIYHLHGASSKQDSGLRKKLLKNAEVYYQVIVKNELSRHAKVIYMLDVINIEFVSFLRRIIKRKRMS